MAATRTGRSIITLVTGMAGTVVTVLAGLAATPLILRGLGDERYGIFRAASDWLMYLGLLELGLGGALRALFARALAQDDPTQVATVLRAGQRAYLRVMIISMVVGTGLAVVLPTLVQVPDDWTGEFRFGVGIAVAGLALLPLAAYRPLAEASQRGYLVHLAITVQALTTAGCAVVFANLSWGLPGQFLATVLGTLAGAVLVTVDGYRRLSVAGTSDPTPIEKELRSQSRPMLFFDLAGRLSLFTDNILIAGLLGPASVASFALSQRLIAAAGAQAGALGVAAWAGLIDLHYRGAHEQFARRLAQLTRLTSLLGLALLVPVAVANHEAIALWVGSERYAGPVVTWLAAGNAWALAVLSAWGWPLNASGRVAVVLPSMLTGTAVNLIVSITATATIGLPGPLLGTAAAFLFVSWWWLLKLLRQHFQTRSGILLGAALRPVLIAIPYTVGLLLLVEWLPILDPARPLAERWLSLALFGGIAAIVFLGLGWFTALTSEDRAEWRARRGGTP